MQMRGCAVVTTYLGMRQLNDMANCQWDPLRLPPKHAERKSL